MNNFKIQLNCVGATSMPKTRDSILSEFLPSILPHTYVSLVKIGDNGKKDSEVKVIQGLHFTKIQFNKLDASLQQSFTEQGIKFINPTDDRIILCDSELRKVSDGNSVKSIVLAEGSESEMQSLWKKADDSKIGFNSKNMMYQKTPTEKDPLPTNCNSVAYTLAVKIVGAEKVESLITDESVKSILPWSNITVTIHNKVNGGSKEKLGFRSLI